MSVEITAARQLQPPPSWGQQLSIPAGTPTPLAFGSVGEVLAGVDGGRSGPHPYVAKRIRTPRSRAKQRLWDEVETFHNLKSKTQRPVWPEGLVTPLGWDGTHLFLRRIKGETLEDLSEHGSKAVPRFSAMDCLSEIGSALTWLHGSGWIHRDVAPGNVLQWVGPGRPKYVLIDLGFSIACDPATGRSLRPHGWCGTHGYLAPRALNPSWVGPCFQDADEIDGYSLGCLILMGVTGHEVAHDDCDDLAGRRLWSTRPAFARIMRRWVDDPNTQRAYGIAMDMVFADPTPACPSATELLWRCFSMILGYPSPRPPEDPTHVYGRLRLSAALASLH